MIAMRESTGGNYTLTLWHSACYAASANDMWAGVRWVHQLHLESAMDVKYKHGGFLVPVLKKWINISNL